jgi:hypothetical protein
MVIDCLVEYNSWQWLSTISLYASNITAVVTAVTAAAVAVAVLLAVAVAVA